MMTEERFFFLIVRTVAYFLTAVVLYVFLPAMGFKNRHQANTGWLPKYTPLSGPT